MLAKKEKLLLLERVINSLTFQKSQRNQELLKYLVHKEIEGVGVKEAIVAIEFYGKDSDFSPNEETIVRVGINSLRKRLEHYFLTEGCDEKIKIEIPAGNYNIAYNENKKEVYRESRKLIVIISASILLLLLVVILLLAAQNKKLKDKFHPVSTNNPVWYEYINSDIPNCLVLGNYFFMYKPYKDYRLFIRDPRVNSIDEYYKNVKGVNEDWMPLEFSFVLPSVASQLLQISPLLNMSSNPLKISLSSEFKSIDFNENNVIYIGTYKSLYVFNQILPLFRVNIINDSIGYNLERLDSDGNIIESFMLPRVFQDNYYTDYSYIGKIKGPGNKTVLIISGGDNVGVTEAMKTILSKDFVSQIKEHMGNSDIELPFYFQMILKTEGLSETGFKHEIVFFEKLPN